MRQPQSPDEVERACRAVEVCCVSALRYGGNDPAIIRRLGNRPVFCDHLLPGSPLRMPGESDISWAQAQGYAPPPAPRRWWHWLLGSY